MAANPSPTLDDALGASSVSSTPAGWQIDGDGWLFRPLRATDLHASNFAHSCHAFTEDGFMFCRNSEQAHSLDRGVPV